MTNLAASKCHVGSKKNLSIEKREMICLQQFYNIFTTNLKWQVIIGCYYWVKKVISVAKFKFESVIINHPWFVIKML